MADSDTTGRLQTAVASALEANTPLQIRAGGSKDFYGRTATGELLDVGDHRGVISYQPSELVITARAGTPLAELEKTLAENHQLLPFEPPHFSRTATIGGTIACGLSGPRRPWGGAVRDLVLGTRIINGRGDVLRFGGEVIKNVAGYDVSRLMTGALGTLGVILDVSMKVLPIPEAEITLAFEIDASTAIDTIGEIAGTACPLSGAMHFDGGLYLRLSGARAGVDAAFKKLGGELQTHDELWRQLRDHSLPFFAHEGRNLWRLSVPPATPAVLDFDKQLVDWGGALRWFFSDDSAASIRKIAEHHNGHAVCFRPAGEPPVRDVFHPLSAAQFSLHRAVKNAFDPRGIFNPGRMYEDI